MSYTPTSQGSASGSTSDSMKSHTDRLLDIDVAEERAHRKVWETRGTVVKTLRKAEGNLRADVARIIGTRDAAE